MPTIRKAADIARKEWRVRHPLAMSSERYLTDRFKIFGQSAQETGDSFTWNMIDGQIEMWEVIEQSIERGVVFDPTTFVAESWKPRPAECPTVIINPSVAFGKPVVEGTQVPTAVLFRQFKAEGAKRRVARWYGVSEETVSAAVEYEILAA